MGLEQTVGVDLENEGERVEPFGGAQPDELAALTRDPGSEVLRMQRTDARVDPVRRDQQIGVVGS